MGSIRVIESRAMVAQKPQPGLLKLMEYLDSQGIPKGICTRNFEYVCSCSDTQSDMLKNSHRLPVTHLLTTFLPSHNFSPIVTRDFRPPKPDPAGLLHIASAWGLVSSSQRQASSEPPDLPIIMVGDSIDDMTAGHRAGAATVLLVNPANDHLGEHEHTDMCIARYAMRDLKRKFKDFSRTRTDSSS